MKHKSSSEWLGLIGSLEGETREPRYVLDDPELSTLQSIKCCRTLAASLDEALQRAEKHYGPGSLNGWGVRTLPTDSVLYGGVSCLEGRETLIIRMRSSGSIRKTFRARRRAST